MFLEFVVLESFTKRSKFDKHNQNKETHSSINKHNGGAILFNHYAKCLVKVYCDIFYYYYWIFNYVFISETSNKLFNLQEKQLH